MDRKSGYLIWAFIILVGAVAYFGYYNFFVKKNFVINSTTECDPTQKSCFVWCEEECEDEYYKKISKRASNIPVCNPQLEECELLICGEAEEDCQIIFCSPETVQEGEICTNPIDFQP